MILGDEQIGRAVTVVITRDDGARIFQNDLVEAQIGSDVLKTIGTKIAKQTYLAFAIGSLTDSDQIDPAVVVVVDGSDAPAPDPIDFRQRDRFKLFSGLVSPERQTRRDGLRKRDIHPSIMVEIEDGDADSSSVRSVARNLGFESSFPRIFEQCSNLVRTGNQQIN